MDDITNVYDAVVIRETDKAILVRSEDLDNDLWVPKSVIHADSEVYKMGTEGTLIVAQWWAEKEAL